MRRASLERHRTVNAWQKHLRLQHGGQQEILCICEHQPNRFRKGQKIGGCGRVRCWMCNREKRYGYPTFREVKHDVLYREMLEEVGLAHWFRWRRMRCTCA